MIMNYLGLFHTIGWLNGCDSEGGWILESTGGNSISKKLTPASFNFLLMASSGMISYGKVSKSCLEYLMREGMSVGLGASRSC